MLNWLERNRAICRGQPIVILCGDRSLLCGTLYTDFAAFTGTYYADDGYGNAVPVPADARNATLLTGRA